MSINDTISHKNDDSASAMTVIFSTVRTAIITLVSALARVKNYSRHIDAPTPDRVRNTRTFLAAPGQIVRLGKKDPE